MDGHEEAREAEPSMEIVMSETRDYKVSLRFVRGYEFVATFHDNEALPPIVFDEPPPLGEGSGPNAAAVLAAAIGNCLAASFAFCLRKVRLEPLDVSAEVVAHVARNEQGASASRASTSSSRRRCSQRIVHVCSAASSCSRISASSPRASGAGFP